MAKFAALDEGRARNAAVQSRDGKTATTTASGKNPEGQPFKNVGLWDKQ